MYTKSVTAADFVYTSESNESCEKHLTQRSYDEVTLVWVGFLQNWSLLSQASRAQSPNRWYRVILADIEKVSFYFSTNCWAWLAIK